MSNSVQMATVWPYQQIIGMGRAALPLILKERERETDHWFWALEAISGENLVPAKKAGQGEEMAKAWVILMRIGKPASHESEDQP